jgi:hypothetical protein
LTKTSDSHRIKFNPVAAHRALSRGRLVETSETFIIGLSLHRRIFQIHCASQYKNLFEMRQTGIFYFPAVDGAVFQCGLPAVCSAEIRPDEARKSVLFHYKMHFLD